MENSLYQEKVGILSRLIKESSLTLEEALLLLKEEEIQEKEEVVAPTIYPGGITTYPSTNPFILQPYSYGTTTTISSGSVSSSNISPTSTTYVHTPNSTSTFFYTSSLLSTSNEQIDLNN